MKKLSSVNNLSQNSLIKIYPNPINNQFQISNSSTNEMKFSIMNLNGQLMHQNKIAGNNSLNVNAENWSNGIYLIKNRTKWSSILSKIK